MWYTDAPRSRARAPHAVRGPHGYTVTLTVTFALAKEEQRYTAGPCSWEIRISLGRWTEVVCRKITRC